MDILSPLQYDALTEAFNLGMGRAADAMSGMVNEAVRLSVPELKFMEKAEAVDYLAAKTDGRLSGVSQDFSGSFTGSAMLLFPVDKSLELVRLLLQDSVPLENLTEFEEEALNEIGNIIINAGLSSLADVFGEEIGSSLPVFKQGECSEIIANSADANEQEKPIMLFLQVDFCLEQRELNGYMVYLLDVNSVNDLTRFIDRYLEKLGIQP